jgi:hypothetical protein
MSQQAILDARRMTVDVRLAELTAVLRRLASAKSAATRRAA